MGMTEMRCPLTPGMRDRREQLQTQRKHWPPLCFPPRKGRWSSGKRLWPACPETYPAIKVLAPLEQKLKSSYKQCVLEHTEGKIHETLRTFSLRAVISMYLHNGYRHYSRAYLQMKSDGRDLLMLRPCRGDCTSTKSTSAHWQYKHLFQFKTNKQTYFPTKYTQCIQLQLAIPHIRELASDTHEPSLL